MTKALMRAVDTALRAQTVTLRAVDYLRVSTEEQADGYGIAYTGKRTARYIEKKGWAHVGTYADEGFSGSLGADDRPDLKRLMQDARKSPRPFDMVVVNEGRTIGRTGRAFWNWVWELEDLGVYVAVVKKDYDNSTPAGRSQMRKDADYAEEERELIRERTQGGIQEKAEDGLYPGGMVPFGWTVAERGKKGVSYYALHEEEAATLRRARQVFLEKRSWQETAQTLNSEKRYTRSGAPWKAHNLRHRMQGDAVLHNRVVWRGNDAQRDQDGNPVYGESVVIDLPPLFSEKEITELKTALAQRRPVVKTRSRVYTLTGLMTSPCGQTYEGHQHRPTEVIYRCKGRYESYAGASDQCSCPPLEAERIERQVWGDVVAILSDADRMKAMAQDWLNATSHKRVDYTTRIADLDQQIAETEDLIDVTAATAARRALRRGLSKAEAEEAAERAVKPLEEEQAALEKQRREAEAWQRESAEAGRRLQGLERLAELAKQNLKDVKPAEQAELLRLMGLQAKVVSCAPRRKGVACSIREWFVQAGRDVPVLTDEVWERIRPLLGGSRSKTDRRTMIEAMLNKAISGARFKELAPKYGIDWKTLQTQAHRWLSGGTWAAAMDLLTDAETVPAWQPDPIDIKVSLKPLAIPGRPRRTPCAPRSPAVRRPG
ncbi:recombinase family protein [Streptomyces sp. Li-HN-5-11]|uniref:recombinase family protein n=1 Tax=Streptomyces sp. Li-HN-5-11 TaxID=3075432 RepID=UPI0028A7DFD1|nr:recombinase family protein [Streptomyces sp. Li-HN-5-11]WNM31318.1 recombinase family protein [Streptomyces sp. Li-HN-5-11]